MVGDSVFLKKLMKVFVILEEKIFTATINPKPGEALVLVTFPNQMNEIVRSSGRIFSKDAMKFTRIFRDEEIRQGVFPGFGV